MPSELYSCKEKGQHMKQTLASQAIVILETEHGMTIYFSSHGYLIINLQYPHHWRFLLLFPQFSEGHCLGYCTKEEHRSHGLSVAKLCLVIVLTCASSLIIIHSTLLRPLACLRTYSMVQAYNVILWGFSIERECKLCHIISA